MTSTGQVDQSMYELTKLHQSRDELNNH